LAEHILNGKEKVAAYLLVQKEILHFWETSEFSPNEAKLFIRLIENDIRDTPLSVLKSGGYVMESIEASIWCFLQRDTYEKVVLTAINLGHDTDTTGAIAGGLAGLYYGREGMPKHWVKGIARLADIVDLGNQLGEKYSV
jgi:ADP-ribosylglycohydrolase